jgi:hypothetical protein
MRIDINQDPEIKLRVLLGKVDDLVNKGIPREHPKVQELVNLIEDLKSSLGIERETDDTQGILRDLAIRDREKVGMGDEDESLMTKTGGWHNGHQKAFPEKLKKAPLPSQG